MRRGCGTGGVIPDDDGGAGDAGKGAAECGRSESAGGAGATGDWGGDNPGSVATAPAAAADASGLRSPNGIRPIPRIIGLYLLV